MRVFLGSNCAIKLLEKPSLYDLETDELYELDADALEFLKRCASADGAEEPQGKGAEAPPENDFVEFCLNEGLLTTTRPTTRPTGSPTGTHHHAPEPTNPAPPVSLRYLELQITRRCNLSCAHCFLGPASDQSLQADRIIQVLREFEQMQGLRVLLTGGEPILHPEFETINQALPDLALRFVLFTNGFALTKQIRHKLNVHEIQVSVDGLEHAHDQLRGKGSYKRAIRTMELALAEGFQVSVSTMVHSGNIKDFETMDTLFRSMGIRDWTVDIPCLAGRLKENKNECCLPPETAGQYLGYGFGGGLHTTAEGYACGHHLMSVSSGGKCAKCSFYEDSPYGDISQGLSLCWSRAKHIPLSALECDCEYLSSCRGGCRYRASQLTSEIGKDLYKCHFHGKI